MAEEQERERIKRQIGRTPLLAHDVFYGALVQAKFNLGETKGIDKALRGWEIKAT